MFVYKIFPSFVFYTDKFIGDKFAGKAFGNIVFIRPSQKDNIPLLQHELVHVKQFYRTFGLHGVFYKLSKKYRLKSEIEAYRVTIKYRGYTNQKQSEWIVDTLLNNYGLRLSQDEIKSLLYGDKK